VARRFVQGSGTMMSRRWSFQAAAWQHPENGGHFCDILPSPWVLRSPQLGLQTVENELATKMLKRRKTSLLMSILRLFAAIHLYSTRPSYRYASFSGTRSKGEVVLASRLQVAWSTKQAGDASSAKPYRLEAQIGERGILITLFEASPCLHHACDGK